MASKPGKLKSKSKSKSFSKSNSTSRSTNKGKEGKKKKKKETETLCTSATSPAATEKTDEKSNQTKSSESKQKKKKKEGEKNKSAESINEKNGEKKEKKKEKMQKSDEKLEGAPKTKEKEPKSGEAGSKTGKKPEKEEASVFEEVLGPSTPVQTGTRGIKNKMRWKIDVEPIDVNGDQKMGDVVEKLAKLRKKQKMKEEGEVPEEAINMSARVLQLVKLESIVSKELSDSEQDTLRSYCRSGDLEEKAEILMEKIVLAVLNAVVSKNEFVRQITIPGQLRMFAVEEKKAKLPVLALFMVRKDLFYASWSKPNRDVENDVDAIWTNMTVKKEGKAS